MLFSKLSEEQQKDFFDHNQANGGQSASSATGGRSASSAFDVHDDWYECLIDEITAALELIGFNDVKNGFWSQGDGANEIPWFIAVHELAEKLQALEACRSQELAEKLQALEACRSCVRDVYRLLENEFDQSIFKGELC